MRTYIEQRFSIPALEQTSSEILINLEKEQSWIMLLQDSGVNLYDALRDLLTTADMVKFAKGSALPDENNRHLKNAYTFVLQTKKVEEDNESKS